MGLSTNEGHKHNEYEENRICAVGQETSINLTSTGLKAEGFSLCEVRNFVTLVDFSKTQDNTKAEK